MLGHSLGGVIALSLAGAARGLRPARVFNRGIMVCGIPIDVEAMSARAAFPPKVFATAEEATARHAGLGPLVTADSVMALAGMARADDAWRPAADPRTNGVGAPDMSALLADAAAPIHLASGRADAMSGLADLRRWDPVAEVFEGLGRNAMIEAPQSVIADRTGRHVA